MKTLKATVKKLNVSDIKKDKRLYYPLAFLIAYLASNATVLSTLSPFAVSITAALPSGLTLAAFFGSMLGYLMFGDLLANATYTIALIAVLAIKVLFGAFTKLRDNAIAMSLAAGGALLLTGLATTFAFSQTTLNLILVLSQAFLAGAMTYFCISAFKTMTGDLPIGMAKSTERCSVLAVAGIMLLSLFALDTGWINIGRVLGILLTLFLMRANGVLGGATGGVITAVCMLLYDGALAPAAGILVISAFFGGLIRPLGRVAQLAMFIVSGTAFTLVAGAEKPLLYQMLDVFAATTLFVLLPERLTDRLSSAMVGRARVKSPVTAVNRALSHKLAVASDTIGDLSTSVKKVSERMGAVTAGSISAVYTKAADTVCRRCGFKLYCWETAYNDTMRAFSEITRRLKAAGKIDPDEIPQPLKSKCCKPNELTDAVNLNYRMLLNKEKVARRVSESRSIAIEQFNGIADMLCEISSELSEVERYDLQAADKVKRMLDAQNLPPLEVSCVIDKYDRMGVDIYLPNGFVGKPRGLSDRLSDALGREFDIPSQVVTDTRTKLSFFERANYTVDFYAVDAPCGENSMCGDSHEFFVDPKGYVYIILSDGMGNGRRAALDSVMTCSLLLKLIKAGFGASAALKLINASLIVKSDDESLATLDIARLDLYMGTVELLKAGAATTFLRRGSEVLKSDSNSLPIGILQDIDFDKVTYRVGDGDIVLLVSDGVLLTGEDWIEAELELMGDKPAKEIAERILKEAKRRNQTGHTDDMTVCAAKIGRC